MNLILQDIRILTPNKLLEKSSILISDGIIKKINSLVDEDFLSAKVLKFSENEILVPGFIDMHVHGAQGYDVMDASDEALETIANTLAQEGVTTFLATTMTAPAKILEKVLLSITRYKEKCKTSSQYSANLLGVHLEGPFISKSKSGAQNAKNILSPDFELLKHWKTLADIKMMTLAPETEHGLELIRFLKKNNIIASVGHSDANYQITLDAFSVGADHVTHLFNAMRSIHHREPGAVTAALLNENATVEVIADGIHLHPAIIDLIYRLKGKDKIILVTDAIRAKCMVDGCYDLGGQQVTVKNDKPQLADGTIAGSVLKMNHAMQNMMQFSGCSLQDVIQMASENPARKLGIFDRKGSIEVNKDADCVVIDTDFKVLMTMCRGNVVGSQLLTAQA